MNIAIHHLGHAHILISINSNRTHTHFLFNDPSFPDLCQGGLRPSQETSLEATGAGFLQCSSSYSANGREPNKSVLNLVPRLSTGCYPQLHRRAACRQSILKITIPTIYVDPSPSTVKNCGRTDGWADRHPPVTQTLLYYAGSVNKSLWLQIKSSATSIYQYVASSSCNRLSTQCPETCHYPDKWLQPRIQIYHQVPLVFRYLLHHSRPNSPSRNSNKLS